MERVHWQAAFGLRCLALLTLAGMGDALAADVPRLSQRVTDLGGILNEAQERELTATLERYQREAGHQFALLTIPSLNGDVIEQLALEVVEGWRLGEKNFENGLLVLVAKEDRKIRIEVGDELEGVITDALSSRIIREVLVPAFKAGEFGGGLQTAFSLLMKAGVGEPVDFQDAWGEYERSVSVAGDVGFLLLIFVVFLVMLVASIFGGGGRRGYRHRTFGGRHHPWGAGSRPHGGRGGSSGGFSGRSGGFGGGGASGSW